MEIILISSIAVLFILFASFAEGIEWKERYLAVTYTEQEKLNRIWHWLQFFERVFAVLFGFAVGFFSGFTWLSAKIIFIVAVGFWIIYDAVINYYASRDLFRPSKTTTSFFEKFYYLKPILLIAAVILLLTGCSGQRIIETVRVDTIKIASPVIEDSLPAKIITDTVVITNKIVDKDTVIDVRYYPVEKKFYIKAKPDTVTITRLDTIAQFITEKSDNHTFVWYFAIGLVILFIIVIIKIRR